MGRFLKDDVVKLESLTYVRASMEYYGLIGWFYHLSSLFVLISKSCRERRSRCHTRKMYWH